MQGASGKGGYKVIQPDKASILHKTSLARTQVTARLFTGAQQESSASCTSSQVKYRVVI